MNKKTKKVLMIAVPVILVLLIALCVILILVLPKDKTVIHVESVTLNQTAYTLEETQTYQLEAEVKPADADDKSVTWGTSDAAIATVSDQGLVTAVAEGSATITVTTTDGGKTATCAITVTKAVIHVSEITVAPATLNVKVNDCRELTATVKPDDAADKSLTWKSSDDKIAIVVEDNGAVMVTALGAGTAKITATAKDGSGVSGSCDITVTAIPVESVTLNENTHTLRVSDKPFTLTAEILPADASDTNVTWKSSNDKVATVSSNGVVTPKGEGTAIITATAGGKSDTCEVTVEPNLVVDSSSVGIGVSKSVLTPGEEFTVDLEITTSRNDYYWQSISLAIVPLNEDGTKYSSEYSKNFEYVEDSYSTNLPAPDPNDLPHSVIDNSVDHFGYQNGTVGYYVSIDLSGIKKPTSESVTVSFKVRVKETAQEIPSFKFGVAPILSNHISYCKIEDNALVVIDDKATGQCLVKKDDKIVSNNKNVECFKVTPQEMKIIKGDE